MRPRARSHYQAAAAEAAAGAGGRGAAANEHASAGGEGARTRRVWLLANVAPLRRRLYGNTE